MERGATISVQCPNCQIIIVRVTSETMVYCITCRKWCREKKEEVLIAPQTAPSQPIRKRRYRCH